MVDQYRNEQHGNPNCCACMITTAEDAVVDYRGQWQSVGNGVLKPARNMQAKSKSISFIARNQFIREWFK